MANKVYMVSSSVNVSGGKNVWEITDDGTTLSITNSWLVGAAYSDKIREIVRDLDGNYYFAVEFDVYKYDSNMNLDTSWGTGGIVRSYYGSDIYGMDVDVTGYLVVGCSNNTGVERTYLFDASGTELWKTWRGTDPGTGIESVNSVRFTKEGDIFEVHSRNSGQSTGAILNRADGTVKQSLHTRTTDTHPAQCEYDPVNNKYWLVWSAISGAGIYITQTTDSDVDDWTDQPPVAGPNAAAPGSGAITYDSGFLYLGSSGGSTYPGLMKFSRTDGSLIASYRTSGQTRCVKFNEDGELVVGPTNTAVTDQDGDKHSIAVFDTDLNKLRGYTGTAGVTPVGIEAVCCTGLNRVVVTPALNDMKTYSKHLVAVGANQFWYESTPGTMSVLTAASSGINTTLPITICEAYEKVFVANQGNLKVYDPGNSKLSTADAGTTACVKGTVLTGTSSGAQMIVDFQNAVTDDAPALIYGKRTTTATFTAEAVTGDGGQAFTLDAVEVAQPHWYDWTPFGNDTATYSNMPAQAYIVCRYRGRLVLAGHNHYPHLWWMSKVGNPWDWMYDSTDPLSAVAGNNVDAGEIGDIIRAMAANGDDFLLFLCANSIWILRGDPIEGGSIDKIDDTIGIFSPWSWCQDSQKNTYFFGTGGFWKIDNQGNSLVNLSFNKLPSLVDDWAVDPSLHRITVAYDPQRHGIIINKILLGDGTNEGLFYSLITEGFYPESYATNCGMHAAFYYEADASAFKHLVVGGTDGFLRYFNDSKKDDDAGLTGDVAINSWFTYAPQKLAEGDNQEGLAKNFCFTVGGGASSGAYSDSDGFSYVFYVADDAETLAEDVLDGATARETGTFLTTGRQNRIRQRVRGLWFTCKCYNNTAAESWVMNKLTFDIKPVGSK